MSAFDIEPPDWFYTLESEFCQRIQRLPKWVKEKLFTLGEQGFNNHLMGVARSLSGHFERDELWVILRACADSYQRDVPDGELEKAVDKSYDGSPKVVARAKVGYDRERVRKLVATSRIKTVDALISAFGQEETDTAKILPQLFDSDPLICVAESQNKAQTMPLSQLLQSDLSLFQFIVPSPMSKRFGVTKDGNKSARCLDNTGERKYLVIEFDEGTQDEQATCIAHLAEFAPLILTVFSGNKSLHAWFEVRETDETTLKRFMDYAITLGADKATWTKCQLVRMPGAMRDNGTRQSVVLFSPMAAELGEWKPEKIPNAGNALSEFLVTHDDTVGMSWKEIDKLRPAVIIEGFLRQGEVLLLGAESKSRKSWLAQDAGFCVATGISWLADKDGENGFSTIRSRVYVFDLELSPAEMRFRFAKARNNRFAGDIQAQIELTDSMHTYSFDGRNVNEIVPRLTELKETVQRGDLVIVDCLYRLVPDGNETTDVANMLETLKRFAGETQSGIILVDHFRKAGDDKARNRFAGSFVKQASANTLVAVEVKKDDVLELNIDARSFHGCPKVHAKFNSEDYTFNRVEEAAVLASKDAARRAEAESWLAQVWKSRSFSDAITAADAGEKWGISRQAVGGKSGRFAKLEERGLVNLLPARIGFPNLWTLTPEGQEVLRSALDLHPDLLP